MTTLFTIICRRPEQRRFEDIPIKHIGALIDQLLTVYGDIVIEVEPQRPAQPAAPAAPAEPMQVDVESFMRP